MYVHAQIRVAALHHTLAHETISETSAGGDFHQTNRKSSPSEVRMATRAKLTLILIFFFLYKIHNQFSFVTESISIVAGASREHDTHPQQTPSIGSTPERSNGGKNMTIKKNCFGGADGHSTYSRTVSRPESSPLSVRARARSAPVHSIHFDRSITTRNRVTRHRVTIAEAQKS